VCNLSREAFVVHEKEVDFLDVADKELLEAVREKVAGLDKWTRNVSCCI
jgi:hypothetical protein